MPLVNRTFNQLIDFTRTTSGTYTNSSGFITSTPASVNLLTYTQEFANAAWTKNNTTITANSTAAPDGTFTADTLDEGTATSTHTMFSGAATLVSGLNYAASIYLKAGSASWVQIPLLSATFGSNAWANFDLVGGAVGNTGSAVVSATITSAGNGWYRCVVVAPATASGSGASLQVGFTDNANSATRLPSYTGSSKTVFAWGAQLEQASTASTYTRNYGGLFPPRFDYDPVTLAPKGLLIEEQRTNLLTYSEDWTNAAWSKTNITVTAAATTSPDGTVDAQKLEATASATANLFSTAVAVTATSATYSIYVKQGSGATTANSFALRNVTTATFLIAGTFNYATGAWTYTIGSTGVTVTNAGNGWWRIQMTATSGITSGDTVSVYTGWYGGVQTAGDHLFAWGAQLEAGAFATSYIPTVASQVTRTADVAAINAPNFASWYNQSEGTVVAEFTFSVSPTVAGSSIYALSDNTANERILVGSAAGGGGNINALVTDGGVSQAQTINTGVATAGTYKYANVYKLNDFASVVNGGAVVTDASGTVPTVDRLYIGVGSSGSGQLNGWMRSIRYYPVRLTNAQLQALTA